MRKKLLFSGIIGVIIASVLFVSYYFFYKTEAKPNNLEKVKVQAGWLLNGEFANVCSSIVNGYYEKEGLDVELIPGGPSGASFVIATNALAANNDIDIAIDGDLVPLLRGKTKEDKNENLKVKAFAAFWNESPYGFIVRADSGINSLKDLAKRKPDGTKYKIGVTADSVAQNSIAEYAGVPVSDLEIVIVGFDATPFLTNQVDALAGYWTTQAYEVEKAGIPYKFLNFGEIPGMSQPSQIALASENTLKNRSEMLKRWLSATIKGSKFAVEHPEEAAKQVLDSRCGGPAFNETQEAWLIKQSQSLFDKERIGWLYKNQISDLAKSYKTLKQIPLIPDLNELIDFSILDSIYNK